MKSDLVMLVTSVPLEHADALREAMAQAGAGKQGKYSHCSFSYEGTGRFIPEAGADPTIGELHTLNAVKEERIEVLCERARIEAIVQALKAAHPYEEPAYHYFPVGM